MVDLNGEWHLYSLDKAIRVTASVPGQVHLDLMRAKVLQDDPYYGTNYVKDSMRRFIHIPWVFEREFFLKEDDCHSIAILDCQGLDTLATITLNDAQMGVTNNQFRHYQFDVSKVIRAGPNSLSIQFDDAVKGAQSKAEQYPYYVPDMFNMSAAQHGFPHRNFIRKEQCSFSWDWGPAFAPCGIWRPISLKLDDNGLLIKHWRLNIQFDKTRNSWDVQVNIELMSTKNRHLIMRLQFDDNDIPSSEYRFAITIDTCDVQHSFSLENSSVQRWWLRGYGEQKLYLLEASLTDEDGHQVASHVFRCGFRTCELIQEPIQHGKPGDAFMFRVNGVDVFAKGTNWIPGHVFDRLMTMEKKK
ncbi:hypothetical protein EDD11_000484 [Mortierella claussenii]|nr:hypothetical protein EDD11_000484 [Mortierella claussenii]